MPPNGGAPQDPQPRGTDGNCGEKTADDRGEDEEGVDPPRVREAHGGEERASEEEAKALEEAGKAGEKDVTQTLKAKEQGGGATEDPPHPQGEGTSHGGGVGPPGLCFCPGRLQTDGGVW